MTDLSKLSIPELRDMQMRVTDGAQEDDDDGLEAFDELAERYRRLEAQRGVPVTPSAEEALGFAYAYCATWESSGRRIGELEVPLLLDAWRRANAATLPPSEVSDGDKYLVRECNELMTLFSSHRDSREFRVAAALKRRIEGG